MTACSRPLRAFPSFVFAFLAVSFSICWVPRAFAHDPFEMTADGRLSPDKLVLQITMSRSTAYALVDPDILGGTSFTPEVMPRLIKALEARAGNILEIEAGDAPLVLRKTNVTITQEEDVEFLLEYAPPTKSPLRFRATHVKKLGYGYGVSLTLTGDKEFLGSKLLMEHDLVLELPISLTPDGTPAGTVGTDTAPARPSFSFLSYLRLGIEHILGGFDHLLFLAALLVVCRSLRGFLVIITCFTLAHSLTLGLAALDILTISPAVVEPLIAASIVYVAVENLVRRGQEPKGRGWLTLTFGLIHGFGFAGALKATGLGRDMMSVALPLFSFNLGVELGQLLVAAVCLPLWWQLRKLKPVDRYGAIAISAVVGAMGIYWLLERTVL